jgi:hypothetical protein
VASWREVEEQAPELARQARAFLDAHTHKTIATLRADGSPRISGTECKFEDGELTFGSMWGAVKARDLLRDPRFALHSGSDDPPDWRGDAKVAGTASGSEAQGEMGRYHLFRADITEVSIVARNKERDKLVIESWHEGEGIRRRER